MGTVSAIWNLRKELLSTVKLTWQDLESRQSILRELGNNNKAGLLEASPPKA